MDEQVETTAPASIEDRFKTLLNTEPAEGAEPDAETSDAEAPAPDAKEEEKAPEAPVVEIDPEAANFEVTIKTEGGRNETVKVSLSELQKGYMMEKDYQRKTKELSSERVAVQKSVKEQVEPVVNKYEHNLRIFTQFAANLASKELQNVDWQGLARDDPAKFVELSARQQEINQLYYYAQDEIQKIETQRQQELQQGTARSASEAVEVLTGPNGIPGWSENLYASVLRAGVENGYRQEEVGSVTDPRAIKVLWKAMKYDELQKAKPSVEKRVAAVPKVIKPGNAESREAPNPEKDLMKQVKRSGGKDSDAIAALFQNRINRRAS